MKKGLGPVVIAGIVFLLGLVQPVSAMGGISGMIAKPFGGRVTSITQGGVVCTGQTGPVSQKSAGQSPSTNYSYSMGGGSSGSKSPPMANSWVLGLYFPMMPNGCMTETEPPTPYSTYRVHIFGKSSMSSATSGFNFKSRK